MKRKLSTLHSKVICMLQCFNDLKISVFSKLAFDDKLFFVTCLDASYYLSIYTERVAYINHFAGLFFIEVNLEALSHVEYLVHFLPIRIALLVNCSEQWWYGEHIIFYYTYVIDEVQYFRLSAS